jgi:hypothetical protein
VVLEKIRYIFGQNIYEGVRVRKILMFGSIIVVGILFAGCNIVEKNIDQSKMCVAGSIEDIKKCKNGELMFYDPSSWGNEKMPIAVIGFYCDTNHQVFMNNSGVVCVFTDKRASKLLNK